VREQLEILEHHAHAAADRAHSPPFGPDLRAVEHDAAGVRTLEGVETTQESRFPRARRADQADHLAAGDAQGQAVEGEMPAEPLDHALGRQDRRLPVHSTTLKRR
jgi:hypothetical protein